MCPNTDDANRTVDGSLASIDMDGFGRHLSRTQPWTSGDCSPAELIRAFVEEDDREAYERLGELFEQKKPALIRRAIWWGIPYHDAVDVVQDTLLSALEGERLRDLWRKDGKGVNIDKYLYNRLKSKVTTYWRKLRLTVPYDTVNDMVAHETYIKISSCNLTVDDILDSAILEEDGEEYNLEGYFEDGVSLDEEPEVEAADGDLAVWDSENGTLAHATLQTFSQGQLIQGSLTEGSKRRLWDNIRKCLGNDLDWQLLWLRADAEMDLEQAAGLLCISYQNARRRICDACSKLWGSNELLQLCVQIELIRVLTKEQIPLLLAAFRTQCESQPVTPQAVSGNNDRRIMMSDMQIREFWTVVRECLDSDMDLAILRLAEVGEGVCLKRAARLLCITHEVAQARFEDACGKLIRSERIYRLCERMRLI